MTERPSKRRKVVASRNYMISDEIIDILTNKVKMRCEREDHTGNVCGGDVVFKQKGTHMRYRSSIICGKCGKGKNDVPVKHPQYNQSYMCDLRETYQSLVSDNVL